MPKHLFDNDRDPPFKAHGGSSVKTFERRCIEADRFRSRIGQQRTKESIEGQAEKNAHKNDQAECLSQLIMIVIMLSGPIDPKSAAVPGRGVAAAAVPAAVVFSASQECKSVCPSSDVVERVLSVTQPVARPRKGKTLNNQLMGCTRS